MSQTATKKRATKPTKQEAQAEREEAIRREAFGKGYQTGLQSGFEDGFIEGQCEGVSGGYARCAANYKDRSFWARLRYLINPNHVG